MLFHYVEPDDNAPGREELLSLLGTNKNRNDWNHSDREAVAQILYNTLEKAGLTGKLG